MTAWTLPLAAGSRLVEATRFMTTASGVTEAFGRWCSSQAWTQSSQCNSLSAEIASSINMGKRSRLICQRLGACNTTNLPATCKLSSRKAGATVVKGGQLVSAWVGAACLFKLCE